MYISYFSGLWNIWRVMTIGVATGLLGVAGNPSTLASNPSGNPSQYYTGVASNPNIGMLATPLAFSASPWQPQGENASHASGRDMFII